MKLEITLTDEQAANLDGRQLVERELVKDGPSVVSAEAAREVTQIQA